jgi:microcystin degradation protein MlrC
MARIALAGFAHETNTFAPMITTFEDFAGKGPEMPSLVRPEEILAYKDKKVNNAGNGFTHQIEKMGHEVVPILVAHAQPAGTIVQGAFDRIMQMITDGIVEAGPFDAVFLGLHGAMVTEDYEDAETETQRRVRKVVGDIPVVASLDLHGNVPKAAVDEFSALVGYRTYPHIDAYETGERAALLMERLLNGEQLKKAYHQLPYLISPSTASSFTEPCISIYRALEEIEKDEDVLSLTFQHGFLLSDINHAGPTVFAYGITQEAADSAAERMYAVLLEHEENFALKMLWPDDAVQQAVEKSKTAQKPIVLADVQDNAGGGGTSDTVWILETLVSHDVQDAALGLMYDPESAKAIHEAGEGSEITLDLGGKLMPGHKPFHGTFVVEKLFEGEFDLTGPMGRGRVADLGKMASIRIGGVRVVVSSVRTQMNDQSYFRAVGIEPPEMKIVVVKSTNHYRADFQPIAQEIIMVEAPGAHMENPTVLPYKNLREGVRLGGQGPEFRRAD